MHALFRPSLFALGWAALWLAPVSAQQSAPRRWGLGAGLGYQSNTRVTPHGLHVLGVLAVPLVKQRLEARVETGVHHFAGSHLPVVACAPFTVCYSDQREQMTVWNGGVGLLVEQHHDQRRASYWIAALGMYGVTGTPRERPYARVG